MDIQLEQHAVMLVEEWRKEFANVMQAMGDFCPAMSVDVTSPVRSPGMLWWGQPIDLAAGAAIWIGAPEGVWSILGKRILAAAGVDSASLTEMKDTYLEVLRQSFGVLARGLSSRLGRSVVAAAGLEQEPKSDQAFGCQLQIGLGDEELPHLTLYISQELLLALQKTVVEGDSVKASQTVPDDQSERVEFSAQACGTLDLLLDVEMPVSVSFGRTQVRIQDILKLISGSVIELDRGIAEPVEIIVNNCTIARGEVVVVDGNYGVRINEVMSRRERLQESRKYLLPASSSRR